MIKFKRLTLLKTLTILLSSLAIFVVTSDRASAAACVAPSVDYGSATHTVNIPAPGSYKVLSRLKASSSDANHNSFLLEIDGNTCFAMGGGDPAGISQANWTWISFADGNPFTTVTHNFTAAGNHTIKLIGNEPNVKLDRVIFTQDTGCVPTGTGDNCASPPDTTPPTVSVSSPAAGATVNGQVTINANASDTGSGIQKVEFRVDGSVVGEDTSAPYSFTWDTNSGAVPNGSHTVSARAFDVAGNNASSANVSVTVQNALQFSCAGSTALVCEDFAVTPDEDSFTFNGGTWTTTQGKLRLTNPAAGSQTTNGNLAIHEAAISGNFDMTATGRVPNSSSTYDDFVVVFNYQNDQNYYFAAFTESNDATTHGIFRIANGVQTELADFSTTIAPDTTYNVKISRRGNTYEAYLNDQKVGTATDASFQSGRVGLGTRNNDAEFDNLVVTPVVSQPPADTQAPTVSVTSPTSGANVSGTFNLTANASDNTGVTRVEFYIDNQLISTDATAPYSASVDSRALTNASHSFTAKAFDAANNNSTSTAVNATVSNQSFAPEDVNQDGHVNLLDFSLLAAKFGQTTNLGRADINSDGHVNLLDFSLLAAKFGQ